MSTENANEPAYPDPMRGAEQSQHNQNPNSLYTGLTKREAFTMAAMQALVSDIEKVSAETIADLSNNVAQWAVIFADITLSELSKPTPPCPK